MFRRSKRLVKKRIFIFIAIIVVFTIIRIKYHESYLLKESMPTTSKVELSKSATKFQVPNETEAKNDMPLTLRFFVKIKTILLPDSFDWWGKTGWNNTHILQEEDCPGLQQKCVFSDNPDSDLIFDALIIVRDNAHEKAFSVSPHILKFHFILEPPIISSAKLTGRRDLLASFYRGSDVTTPYGKWVYFDPTVKFKTQGRDYITEKLFKRCHSIVLGAHPEDYKAICPENSYIHVEDFQNPEELANYMKQLADNHTAYNSYFRWKDTGQFINTNFFCRVCTMVHFADIVAPPKRTSAFNWNKHAAVSTRFCLPFRVWYWRSVSANDSQISIAALFVLILIIFCLVFGLACILLTTM
ncbi:Glycoprotein 3-alpha-L-fucosyltransferase A [Orchesella cincta]|uniref:Fucosyltransferase n=1 Tax=Orchesella cincta TaxID=48709 RepID=A0A1D2M7B7_ORCCI|nr:Glycoprotein 3-alpha-L-fucosyltransferase A [Orchesella cincta]